MESKSNSPKTTQSVLAQVKLCFVQGDYKSVPELASRFDLNPHTLQNRITREKWVEKRESMLVKVGAVVEKKALTQAEEYLSSSFLRGKRYEQLIEASIAQNAVNEQGIPVASPSDLDSYTKSEARLQSICFNALRIPTAAALDVTSGGKSLGANLIDAIQTLRDAPVKPLELSPDQVTYINSLDIV